MSRRDDLIARVVAGYRDAYGAAPTQLYAAPGRVNLIGEHVDYNDGFVLPCAIDREAIVALGPADKDAAVPLFEAVALDMGDQHQRRRRAEGRAAAVGGVAPEKLAQARVLEMLAQRPNLVVRCSSEMPFFPGAQKVIDFVKSGAVGPILEVEAHFLHSSDINPDKPLNWKRMSQVNGAYGCLGDLGMHVLHVPLRLHAATHEANFGKLLRQRIDLVINDRRGGHFALAQAGLAWVVAIVASTVATIAVTAAYLKGRLGDPPDEMPPR